MTKKVKKYNLESARKRWLEEEDAKEFLTKANVKVENLRFDPEYLWVVEGCGGSVVSYDCEGVHWIHSSNKDEIDINLIKHEEKLDDKGNKVISMGIFPIGKMHVPLGRITSHCEFEEGDVKDMVRTFGRRLDTNYSLLLKSLQKIGLDLSEYNTDRKQARGSLRE